MNDNELNNAVKGLPVTFIDGQMLISRDLTPEENKLLHSILIELGIIAIEKLEELH